MATTVDPSAYKEVLVVLATAGVVIPLFHRLRITPILGFLVVGILIGPSGLGRFALDYPWLSKVILTEHGEIDELAELGVVFLLFLIGLELSLQRVLTMKRLVFGFGAAQVGITAVIIAIVSSFALPTTEAVLIGAALSLSSTAIVVELLSNQKRLSTHAGRLTFSVLLFQDLAVVPMLLLVSILGAQQDRLVFTGLITALAQALIAVTVVVIVGQFLLRPFLRLVAATRSADLFLAATLLIVVGTGLATSLSGLSMALGAFIAGLLLAETEFRREIETLIEPFKGLLLGAFFLLVGMGINLSDVAARPLTILGLAALLIVLKAAIVAALGLWFRIERDALAEAALLLGPGGEFAFVLLGAGSALGVVSAVAEETVSVIVSLTMAMIPLLSIVGRYAGGKLKSERELPPEAMVAPHEEGGAQVVIAGFGRVGQLVASMLKEHGIAYLAIDADPRQVARVRREGWPVYYGDATRGPFLRNCGLERARTLVITLDQPAKVDEVVAAARGLNPAVRIVARARDSAHAQRLYATGVTDAVPEAVEASLQLAESVLVETGVPMGLAIASIHERRDGFRKLLGRPDRRRLLAAEKYGKPPAQGGSSQ